MEAALLISGTQMTMSENKITIGQPTYVDSINDCKEVVYSYLSRKMPEEDANMHSEFYLPAKLTRSAL
ncbi:hypothetical protein SLA2020_311820 [Shorea laevis]